MDASLLDEIIEYFGKLYSAIFKKSATLKRTKLGKGFRLLGGGLLGFSILTFIFSYFAIERNISGAICCMTPFFTIGVIFLGLARLRDKNSLK